jgi:hypothetical protein
MKYIFLLGAIFTSIFFSSCSNYLTVMAKDALECRVKKYDAFVALKSGDTIAGKKVNIDYKKAKVNLDGVGYDFSSVNSYQTKKALLRMSGKQDMRYLRIGQISMCNFTTYESHNVGQYPNNKTNISSSNEIRLKKGDKFYWAFKSEVGQLISDKPKVLEEFNRVFKNLKPNRLILSYEKLRNIIDMYNA